MQFGARSLCSGIVIVWLPRVQSQARLLYNHTRKNSLQWSHQACSFLWHRNLKLLHNMKFICSAVLQVFRWPWSPEHVLLKHESKNSLVPRNTSILLSLHYQTLIRVMPHFRASSVNDLYSAHFACGGWPDWTNIDVLLLVQSMFNVRNSVF